MSMIKLSFMGVQPIDIDSDFYATLISKKISFEKLDNISKKKYSAEWLHKYGSIYDVYNHLYEWDISDESHDLKKDFFRQGPAINKAGKTLQLSQYLTCNSAKLYFDPQFVYFVLVYQIEFEVSYEILNDFLDYDATENNLVYNDLYNTIRKSIVREQSNSSLSEWGKSIHRSAIFKIKDLLEYLYQIKVNVNEINIIPNSCNISNFVVLPKLSKNDVIIEKFITLNLYAERLTSEVVIEPKYNQTVYFSFNGRFHTIILKNKQDKYRFQPLQFHIQYMWFLVERYNKIMHNINRDLMQNDTIKQLEKHSKLIHIMINKIELLGLHDMNFKHSIEVDINLYEENEKKWSIPNLYEASKRYVNFFKDYLERSFNQKNIQFQKKINLTLLIISFMQVLALVSVWNDYLSMLNKNNLDIDSRLLKLFGGIPDKLLTFNLFVPLILIITIFGLSVYIWKHRAK